MSAQPAAPIRLRPDEFIEMTLQAATKHPVRSDYPRFGYPGERAALIFSFVISAALAVALGALSFGIAFLLLGANLVYLLLDRFRNPHTMIPASDRSFKSVFRLARLAAYRLRIPLPPVYVEEGPEYNAYTKGFHRYGFIVLQSALVHDFRPLELLFVLGHEMGHIKRYHTTWLNLMQPARATGASFLLAPVMRVIFNVWSVKSEYTADQAGLVACRSLEAAVMTMLKLAGGHQVEKELDLSHVLQSHEPDTQLGSELLEYLSTHPFSDNRIRQLVSFASSTSFREASSSHSHTTART